jgi:hypothetical protein
MSLFWLAYCFQGALYPRVVCGFIFLVNLLLFSVVGSVYLVCRIPTQLLRGKRASRLVFLLFRGIQDTVETLSVFLKRDTTKGGPDFTFCLARRMNVVSWNG